MQAMVLTKIATAPEWTELADPPPGPGEQGRRVGQGLDTPSN
jgi:hypothetical protein